MRKQFILLTLFMLVSGQFSAQAQLRKASDYFPLKVGNVWEYDHPRQSQFQLFEVINDTLIADTVRVYEVSRKSKLGNGPWVTGAPYYFHYNSDSSIVYRDDFVFPETPLTGLPMIDTRHGILKLWHYIIGDYTGDFAVVDTGSAPYFGEIRRWADVYGGIMNADSTWSTDFYSRFVEGIGVVHQGETPDLPADTLVYARIDGRSYGTIVNVRENDGSEHTPEEFSLRIYPNPVYSATAVKINGIESESVELYVVNVLGQRVRTLFRGRVTTPQHTLSWDGKDDAGNRLPNGVYLLVFKSPKQLKTQKMLYFAKLKERG